MPDDTDLEQIDPVFDLATYSKIGSMSYDHQENGYNLEWELRAKFSDWLTNKQAALGIKIWVSKTWASKLQVYSTCETFCCARNGTGRKVNYIKKTARERKIDSKWIEGGCHCFVQIKTYPYTSIVLGKYNHDHSHPTGKDNLKYIQIQAPTHELIETWVYYGVTD